jgi:hypothetical protein
MIIYLYVKTHNVTGLKYLGKTIRKDPHKYPGSGTRWTNHLKVHGYDYTTTILKECTSNEEVKELGLYYSELWNVVDSDDWANLKPENSAGGFGKPSPEIIAKILATKLARDLNKHSQETISKISAARLTKFAAKDPTYNVRPKCRPEKAAKIKEANTGKKWVHNPENTVERKQLDPVECERYLQLGWKPGTGPRTLPIKQTCPHCNNTFDPGNYKQHHSDNCRYK